MLRQAEKDLEKAKLDLQWEYYEWACFTTHQASEKAIKAVFQHLHGEAWGHGIKSLLENLPFDDASMLLEEAKYLDKLYIPTRYPNGLPQGSPHEYFTKREAEEAVRAASKIYVLIELTPNKLLIKCRNVMIFQQNHDYRFAEIC